MDELLLTVGATKLRWRPNDTTSEPSGSSSQSGLTGDMNLMLQAFQMGHSAGQAAAQGPSKPISEPARPSFPALQNGSAEDVEEHWNFAVFNLIGSNRYI